MYKKTIKTLISIVITVIILLLLAYGVSKSNFGNIKKYDQQDSIRTLLDKKQGSGSGPTLATDVEIQNNGMANLGDFIISISNNKQLIANISVKYRENKKSGWMSGSSFEKELVNKGPVLRSSVIHTLSDNPNASISNKTMKKDLVNELNNYLSDGEVEEVYFNKFIIN